MKGCIVVLVLLQNFVCKHAQKRIRISDAVANIRFAHNSVNARHDGVFDVRANVADGVVVHIKRATRDICLLRKLAYGDVGHVLFLHKLFERLEDRVFGFDDSFINSAVFHFICFLIIFIALNRLFLFAKCIISYVCVIFHRFIKY